VPFAPLPIPQQMPSQGVTHLIAAPQGVLRNFYPLDG
jgi:hypothetical protein